MRTSIYCLVVGCFSLFFQPLFGSSQTTFEVRSDVPTEIEIHLHFPAPELSNDGSGATRVAINGLLNTMEAGLPSLPFKTVKIVIPNGFTLKQATFKGINPTKVQATPTRASSQVPLSWLTDPPQNLPPSSAPTFRTARYPASRVQRSIQRLHGVDIAILNIYPVVYDQSRNELHYVAGGKLSLSLTHGDKSNRALRPHQQIQIQQWVDNPTAVYSYGVTQNSLTRADYDYLIITNDQLASYQGDWDLTKFKEYLVQKLLKPKMVTVAAINQEMGGTDPIENIRNYIRKQYDSYGLQYVLLAGDGDKSGTGSIIPTRRLWSKVRAYLTDHWTTVEQQIAADFYYSCLDGTFNGNNNDHWGEPTDGPDGKDVDLLPEVTVGRIPIESVDELSNFVQKTLSLASNKVSKKTLFLGEELFAQLGLYGDDYMDQLIGKCTDHAYETNGYTSDWSFTKLYDHTKVWDGQDALSEINKGHYSMVNHLGHSNQTYNMKLSCLWDTISWENTSPFFYYTQGCFPGDFTYSDCFIEKMLRHSKSAAAAIANTSYGLAPEDPQPSTTKTPGASQMLHRQFINALFSKSIEEFGRAHQQSKVEFIGLASAQEIRWVFWVATYFGDPSLKLQH
ncbi:MAG: hypothetical protein HY537_18100 [Deltaproteobacteria bacterium]|nr:hypothetical protein [Deltaproteobacteria bacterium]